MKSFSCFVTGTDTGIGKTLVTCSIIHLLSKKGFPVAGMKPIAAGATWRHNKWHNEDTDMIINTANISLQPDIVSPYLFKTAASPHIAASFENDIIQWSKIKKYYDQIKKRTDSVIVEGVGGFMVPLSNHYTVADLAVQFALPIVLVVGLRLGCINHALLTAESILSRNLHLAGWVANQTSPELSYCDENIASLEQLIPAPRLATIPYIKNISIEKAATYFDFSKLDKR